MEPSSLDSVVRVPTSLDTSFFRWWVEFLRPIHKMSPRRMEVLAAFLKHRYFLSLSINDQDLLDKVTLNSDSRKKIADECNISTNYMQVIFDRFKREEIIKDDKINLKFIPDIKRGSDSFKLLLYFQFK